MNRNRWKCAFTRIFVLTVIAFVSCESGQPVKHTNARPAITSPRQTEAAGGVEYGFHLSFTDPDGPSDTIKYSSYPSWLTVAGDSLRGVPPGSAVDTSFLAIVSDGPGADTARISVTITPTIVIYGDTRTDHEMHRRITELIIRTHPAVVFHTGDLVEDGTRENDWTMFNSISAPLRAIAEFYPALGNHEKQSPLFFSTFNLPNNEEWYSVDRNRIQFVVLNSNAPLDMGSVQYHWLDSTLAHRSDSAHFTVMVFHHPPYSSGSHREDEKGLRQTIVPLFQRYNVGMVFNGHDHDYERSHCDGIYYIVAGGGGAPLYDQMRQLDCSEIFVKTYHFCKLSRVGDRLMVSVFDQNNQVIDKFQVQR